MKKIYVFFLSVLSASAVSAQSTLWMAPDSAANVIKPGAGPAPAWTINNPLMHTGSVFTNGPINSGLNNSSDYLYFKDFDIAVPNTATITGIQLIISRGACNSGSYFLDTVSLAYNGMPIGNHITDSVNSSGNSDTLGSSTNLWGNTLTPAIVNSNGFGIFFSFHSFGICTFGVFDCRVKVHYTGVTGITETVLSKEMKIYPNPATATIVVESAMQDYSIADQAGRVVLSGKTINEQGSLDVSSLSPGLYFIRSGNDVAKFIKK